jgi:hypothetical protein
VLRFDNQGMERDPTRLHEQLRLLYIVFMVSLGIYVLLGFQLQSGSDDLLPLIELSDGVLWAFRGALAILAAADLMVGHFFLRRNAILRAQRATASWSAAFEAFTASIFWLACAEAVGIFGLLLLFLGGSIWELMAFGAVSLVAIAIRFPTEDAWEAHVAELERAHQLAI